MCKLSGANEGQGRNSILWSLKRYHREATSGKILKDKREEFAVAGNNVDKF
jgi:hypothetical protein